MNSIFEFEVFQFADLCSFSGYLVALGSSLSSTFGLSSVSSFVRSFEALKSFAAQRFCRRYQVMGGDSIECLSNGKTNTQPISQRTYQVVVAATPDMGIGKDGKLPWKLPGDLKFFKEITATTSDPNKKNVVMMGRKTWESIPPQFRPLPGRLNVILTRSGSSDVPAADNVIFCGSLPAALKLLAEPSYSFSIEKVFLIGGGQILREALNAPECDAIHITEIKTSIDCDTFIPPIDMSLYQPCGNGSTSRPKGFKLSDFTFLPKFVFEKHEEFLYLRLVQDIISNGNNKDDRTGTGTLSKFGCQMRFNLHKYFPLPTTKYWIDRQGRGYTNMHADYTEQGFDQLLDVIDKIKNKPDDRRIILSAWNPSDLKLMALPPCHMFAQFYVANGELCCQMYQRSAYMGLGVPFNIASYALLTCMIARLVPGDFVHVIGDAHVYKTHVCPLQEQLKKLPRPFPSLISTPLSKQILMINPHKKDIDSFVAADFELRNYVPHPMLEMKMAV
ncbi:hypothetical protein DH2020_014373 [Rehmannia glutinosa]|uniref:Bifunctional dihydrofolate reductase-thymidylate synthase n=1 Tax=Rehmannia glutinosa TaxID=99300 RepID=A0ABR0WW87_REHGL